MAAVVIWLPMNDTPWPIHSRRKSRDTRSGVVSTSRPILSVMVTAVGAPDGPGVYFFIDGAGDVLYVGKAANIRRRLAQHALDPRVAGIRWELAADEDAATAREADLIVALQPALNRSIKKDGRWAFLVVRELSSFQLVRSDAAPPASKKSRVYGCFPHLGVGVSSRPAIGCSDGYTSLLRVLWATADRFSTRPYPRAISGPSPPDRVDI